MNLCYKINFFLLIAFFFAGDRSQAQDNFDCTGELYQVISGELKIFNPIASSYTDIGPSGVGSYNAAGFNVKDGFIYAIATIDGGKHVVKFGDDGIAADHGLVANFSGASYRADIDTSGNWISYEGGSNPQLRVIDLDVFPLTMEAISLQNLYSGNIPGCADITFNPKTKKLYGMSGGFDLIEIDIFNLTIDVVKDFPGSGGAFGAAWSDREGFSYFSNNANGEIHRVNFDEDGLAFGMQKVAQGIVTSNNDGMNCMLAAPPFETDCGDGIDNDGDGLIDSEDPDCTEVPEFTTSETGPFGNDLKDSWGVTFVDFNKDSYEDVFLPSYSKNQSNALYVNDGNGSFTAMTEGDFLDLDQSSVAGSWVDLNDDGYLDLAIANNNGSTNELYLSNNFVLELSTLAELPNADGYSHGITFFDIENDGALDLFVSDYFETEFNSLFRNNGDGSFEKLTTSGISTDAAKSIGATCSDVDGNGFVDVFVPNYGSENVLYLNNGDGTFESVGMGDNATSTGCSFADFDNDGDIDLFVANASEENNLLYENDGNGNFTSIDGGFITADGGNSHGSCWADLDKDGWLDLYVTNDRGGAKFLYMNNGDGTFGKSLISNLITPTGNSFGVASADFDNDGDLDLAVSNHSDEQNFLFVNEGNSNNYINILLEGTNSNFSAIGAKIYVTATIDDEEIRQMREVSAQTGGGPGSQNSFYQFFGLAKASSISHVEIHWPSGYVQLETEIEMNQKITIVEDTGAEITGRVYQDFDANCIFDGDDYPLPGKIVELTPGPRYALTDEDGYYRIFVEPGNYDLTLQSQDNYSSDCLANDKYSVTATSVGQLIEARDFALTAIDQKPDLSIDLGVTALRRGFENEMVLSYSNFGTEAAYDVELTLELDEFVSLESSDVLFSDEGSFLYRWELGTVAINETAVINLENYVDLEAELGSTKEFTASISASNTEWTLDNNTVSKNEIIVGAVDPNDIAVTPKGYGAAHFVRPDDTLRYKIRFQNTGNYPASRVVVFDTLPEYLDMNSIRMGAVSHEYQIELMAGGILVWTFENINLPDSTANEEASHGFIQFQVVPRKGLADLTRIENRAAIQFDYNLPVITNTVFNTINSDWTEIDIDENKVFLSPNPASDFLRITVWDAGNESDMGEWDTADELRSPNYLSNVEIIDSKGRVAKSFSCADYQQELKLNVDDLDHGFYLVRCTGNNGRVLTAKLVVN